MENIMQNLFNESLNMLQKNEFQQSSKLLYQLLEKMSFYDVKNNSFILFNLGICELNQNNIPEALNYFLMIYQFYNTNKELSIAYVPHLETIFNNSDNYKNGHFKYYSKKFDNVDLIYALINSYFVSDYCPDKTFIDKVNSNIKDEIMQCYFSHIYKMYDA